MKIRTFFITFLAPCMLFLLAAQLMLNISSSFKQRDTELSSLKMAIMLETGLSEDSVLLIESQIKQITGQETNKVTPAEELKRFNSKFGVDVMQVLSDNPFGETILTGIDLDVNPSIVQTTINKIRGVEYVVFPKEKRTEIERSFETTYMKYKIYSVFLFFVILLLSWQSERFVSVANETVIDHNRASRMPKSNIKRSFLKRAFVKGTFIGLVASLLFVSLNVLMDMNNNSVLNLDTYLMISAIIIISSVVITYIMQLVAINISIKKNR